MAIDQNKLNDLFGSDWGSDLEGELETDDTGELVFSDKSGDSNDLNEDESDEADAESSDDDSEASDGEDESDSGESDEVDPVESRFQSLESSVDKLTSLLEQIASKLTGQQTSPKEEELDDDEDDVPLTRKELRKMMKEAAAEAVKPLNQQTKEQQEAKVVNDLLAKHGDDFKAAIPAMKKILATNPDLGIQGAWDLVSEIRGPKQPVKPKATTQDSGGKKPVKTGQAADLKKKAETLNTAKGVSGSGKDKKRAVGIDDIIKQSWDDVFES